MRNYLKKKIKKKVTSEGAVSYNFVNNPQVVIAHHQVSFYVNNYFELQIVSSPFNLKFIKDGSDDDYFS